MQPAPTSTIPTWAYVLAGLATTLASLVGAVVTYVFTRPKQAADIEKTHADAGKTEAETRQIDSEILHKAYARLDDFETLTRQLNSDIIKLERAKANLEWRLSLSEQREKVHLEEIRIANAELELLREKAPFNPADPVPKPL